MARVTRKAGGGLDNARSGQLLRLIARGDRAALGELYDGYAPIVLAVAQRMLGTRSAAEELVHEVFVEVWQRAGDYTEQRASIHTQLLLRTRARALARLRAQPSLARAALEVARQAPPPLRGVVFALPAEQRAVLELGYFGGYTSLEIAEKLSLPVATVKERMASAIAYLRLQLDEA